MTSSQEFSLPVLQAISDWQCDYDQAEKAKRGAALAAVASHLQPRFKTLSLMAFRRFDLTKTPLWQLLADGHLPETISSWTLTTDVAKTFKGGVPPAGWQGVIVQCAPADAEVILNLATLYRDAEFKKAIERHKSKIRDFDLGMGQYGAVEDEVVIRREVLTPGDIYALGGYSSTPEQLGRVIFGRDVTADEIGWMRASLRKQGDDFGPWWLDGERKDKVLERTRLHIPRLLEQKRLQEVRENGTT